MKVAILQTAPVYFDLPASLTKLDGKLREAAAQGVQLAVLGETWLTGYPSFLDHLPGIAVLDDPAMKQVFQLMHTHAVEVPGPTTAFISALCKELGLGLVIGVNEKVSSGYGSGTLFNSMLVFGPDGTLLNHHRKLMPTYTEKLLYGQGDGAGLRASQIGEARVGGLICWEHWMPPARQVLHEENEHIHVALWPTVHERHQIASRQYAFEGRCFVLAAGQLLSASELPGELTLPPALAAAPANLLLTGGSCIIGPDGNYLVPPVFEREEMLVAELDLGACIRERMTLDVTGHYARPDVFQLTVNRTRPVR